MRINDAAVRNLCRPEVREVQKKRLRWDWTRCRPLMWMMAAVVIVCYLKWAGFIR